MRICFCALATGRIPTMSQLLQASEPSFERGPQNLKDISNSYICIVITLWITPTYQIFEPVTAIYDEWMSHLLLE